MTAPDIDDWLPDPDVRTLHRRRAAADPGALWEAASSVRLDETRTMGRLVRWRIPGLRGDQTYRSMLADYPFTVLDEGPHHSISGLCGRIWTLQRDYPRLDGAAEWRAWSEPRTVRVLFAHWAQADGDGGAEIVSEVRVAATDRIGGARLRALWVVVGRFERLIGAEPLGLAARRVAER